jgi:uncharacterized protein DUF5989
VKFLAEFGAFLAANKKLWLLPLVVTAVVMGLLILLTGQSTIAPFLYTLF